VGLFGDVGQGKTTVSHLVSNTPLPDNLIPVPTSALTILPLNVNQHLILDLPGADHSSTLDIIECISALPLCDLVVVVATVRQAANINFDKYLKLLTNFKELKVIVLLTSADEMLGIGRHGVQVTPPDVFNNYLTRSINSFPNVATQQRATHLDVQSEGPDLLVIQCQIYCGGSVNLMGMAMSQTKDRYCNFRRKSLNVFLFMAETRVVLQCPSFRTEKSCKGCTLSSYTILICILLSLGLMGSTIDVETSLYVHFKPDTGWIFAPNSDRLIAIFVMISFSGVILLMGLIQAWCVEKVENSGCQKCCIDTEWDTELPNTCSACGGRCFCSRALVSSSLSLIITSVAISVAVLTYSLTRTLDLPICDTFQTELTCGQEDSPCYSLCSWDEEKNECVPESYRSYCYVLDGNPWFSLIGPTLLASVLLIWGSLSCCLKEMKVAGSDGETFEFEEDAEHHEEEAEEGQK
jgi:hypothetical protein